MLPRPRHRTRHLPLPVGPLVWDCTIISHAHQCCNRQTNQVSNNKVTSPYTNSNHVPANQLHTIKATYDATPIMISNNNALPRETKLAFLATFLLGGPAFLHPRKIVCLHKGYTRKSSCEASVVIVWRPGWIWVPIGTWYPPWWQIA